MLSSSKECFFIKLKMKKNWGWREIRVKKFFSYKSKGMFSLHFIVTLTRNNYFVILIDSFQKQHPGKQPGEFDSMVSPSYNSYISNKSENWMQALSIIIIWVISCNVWHCTDSKMDVHLENTHHGHCTAYLMQNQNSKQYNIFSTKITNALSRSYEQG